MASSSNISSTATATATATAGAISRKPKKVNLLDHVSVKHLLDGLVSEVVTSKGYAEDVRMTNLKLLIGLMCIVIALAAEFYPNNFPKNRSFLLVCILLYLLSSGLLLLISHLKEKNAILFTDSLPGSFNSTGLMISSKLPRFSETYTLTVSSADPKSASAKRPVQLTKSVTKWFTKDGFLVEGLFWKDVERLIGDYSRDLKKTDVA